MPQSTITHTPIDDVVPRRAVTTSAVWTVPALAVALAAPAASASPSTELGAFKLNGSCGTLGILGPGFTLTASAIAALPIGTTILISGTGIANIGVFSVTGGVATVTVVSPTSRSIVLTSAVAPNTTISFRTTLSISVAFTLNATVVLPPGYTAVGAKTTGSVSSTLILCSAT